MILKGNYWYRIVSAILKFESKICKFVYFKWINIVQNLGTLLFYLLRMQFLQHPQLQLASLQFLPLEMFP